MPCLFLMHSLPTNTDVECSLQLSRVHTSEILCCTIHRHDRRQWRENISLTNMKQRFVKPYLSKNSSVIYNIHLYCKIYFNWFIFTLYRVSCSRMLNNQTSVQNSAQNVLNNDPSKQEQMIFLSQYLIHRCICSNSSNEIKKYIYNIMCYIIYTIINIIFLQSRELNIWQIKYTLSQSFFSHCL